MVRQNEMVISVYPYEKGKIPFLVSHGKCNLNPHTQNLFTVNRNDKQ